MFKTSVIFVSVFQFLLPGGVMQHAENCDKLGILLYEEIGCKPIKNIPDDTCPSSYDCKHLDEPGEHCYFQGKKYKDREVIPDEAIQESCNGGCFCDASAPRPSFKCAVYDCPEFIGGNPLNGTDCIRTYKLNSCCSSGQICPPFDNIATCLVGQDTYKEGQTFSPKDSCAKCVCQRGFKGKYIAPYCKRMNCATELRHSDDVKNKCAPVYEKDGVRCCPNLWVCLSESDVFTPAQKDKAFVRTCQFGEKEIKNGQALQTTIEKYGKKHEIKCDCQLPPLLTCLIQHSEYIKY